MASTKDEQARRAEALEVARRAAAIERELGASLARASARARRAIASVAAEQRDSDRRTVCASSAARAWARPPLPTLNGAFARIRHAGPWAKVARPDSGGARIISDGTSVLRFHFKLHQTRSAAYVSGPSTVSRTSASRRRNASAFSAERLATNPER